MKKKSYQGVVTNALSRVIHDQGWDQQLDMHSVFLVWEELVGETLASCTRPIKIVKGTLWVEVDTSSWMQQIQFEKVTLLEKINDSLKISRIRDLRFLLPEKLHVERKLPETQLRFLSPDGEELKKFQEQTAGIDDEKSREALVRLWYLSHACKRE